MWTVSPTLQYRPLAKIDRLGTSVSETTEAEKERMAWRAARWPAFTSSKSGSSAYS
jgi:hypothetical protein